MVRMQNNINAGDVFLNNVREVFSDMTINRYSVFLKFTISQYLALLATLIQQY